MIGPHEAREIHTLGYRDIRLRPVIPDRLRLAATQGIVIPFIGAGVSQFGGCPGWNDFADAALRFFLKLGKIDQAQFDQLSRQPARVKLSVAIGPERQFETQIDFKRSIATGPRREREDVLPEIRLDGRPHTA